MPWQVYTWIKDKLNAELVPIDERLNLLRRVKSPLEIELLWEALRITELAFSGDECGTSQLMARI
jgi:Xaa-Pro aminopeptidase